MDKRQHVQRVSVAHGRLDKDLSNRSLLDISAAASRLGCSDRFIRRLVQERRIPFVKLAGSKVRFEQIDIDLWLCDQRVEAVR